MATYTGIKEILKEFTNRLRKDRYAVCSTTSATAEKVAILQNTSHFTLETGVKVTVKFTNANSATSPTLKLQWTKNGVTESTTAKSISDKPDIGANEAVTFVYDGSVWRSTVKIDSTLSTTGNGLLSNKVIAGNVLGYVVNSTTANCVKTDNTKVTAYDVTIPGVSTPPVGFTVKVLFKSQNTNCTYFAVNKKAYEIKVNKNNSLVTISAKTGRRTNNFPSDINQEPVTSSLIWKEYTTLELIFNGTDWVIMGNPLFESSYSLTRSWRVYADGLVEQWGKNDLSAGLNQNNRNLYRLFINYSNVNYFIFFLPQTGSGSDDHGDAEDWYVVTKSSSEFTARSSANDGGYWYTKGY